MGGHMFMEYERVLVPAKFMSRPSASKAHASVTFSCAKLIVFRADLFIILLVVCIFVRFVFLALLVETNVLTGFFVHKGIYFVFVRKLRMKKALFLLILLALMGVTLTTTAAAAPTIIDTPTSELGQLKICKVAGTGVTVGQLFNFQVGS